MRRTWSGYRPFKLRYCRIIGVRSSRSATEPPLQPVVRRLERLRDDPYVAHDRDEVGVAVPPRHDVQVQVVDDPGPGHPPLVQAHVEALGPVLRTENPG